MGCSIAGIPQNENDTSTTPPPPDPDSGETINENKDTGTVTEQYFEEESWTQDGAYDEKFVPLLVQTSKVPSSTKCSDTKQFDLYGDVGTTLVLQGQLFAQDTSGCRTAISGTIDFCMLIQVEVMTIHLQT